MSSSSVPLVVLEAEERKALHDLQHHVEIQRRLAAVEGDVHLLAGEVLVHEGGQFVDGVFDMVLRAEHIADAERAVGAFQVALERGQQLQLTRPPTMGSGSDSGMRREADGAAVRCRSWGVLTGRRRF
jgi:hypothetical protein